MAKSCSTHLGTVPGPRSQAAFMEGRASPSCCCLACGVYVWVCAHVHALICACAHAGKHTHAIHQVLHRMCILFGWHSSLSKMSFEHMPPHTAMYLVSLEQRMNSF